MRLGVEEVGPRQAEDARHLARVHHHRVDADALRRVEQRDHQRQEALARPHPPDEIGDLAAEEGLGQEVQALDGRRVALRQQPLHLRGDPRGVGRRVAKREQGVGEDLLQHRGERAVRHVAPVERAVDETVGGADVVAELGLGVHADRPQHAPDDGVVEGLGQLGVLAGPGQRAVEALGLRPARAWGLVRRLASFLRQRGQRGLDQLLVEVQALARVGVQLAPLALLEPAPRAPRDLQEALGEAHVGVEHDLGSTLGALWRGADLDHGVGACLLDSR
ncbi:MAG: hypothetical protein QM765_51975 [Myxococcales bacterium]